jgi:hypothetical protein
VEWDSVLGEMEYKCVMCVQLEGYVYKSSLNFDVDIVPGVSYVYL